MYSVSELKAWIEHDFETYLYRGQSPEEAMAKIVYEYEDTAAENKEIGLSINSILFDICRDYRICNDQVNTELLALMKA
ncbi:hypothetical protein CN918_31495 [Priestia megaterium]|nr:hypothetical protein CN918_31495 [Priestia megaterium]